MNGTVTRLRERLRSWARGRSRAAMRARYDTSDILQEASLQVWLELRKGARESTEYSEPLLKTIAHGHGAKLAQHNRAACRSVERSETLSSEPPESANAVETSAIQNESALVIAKALMTLPADDRNLVNRRFFKDQSYSQIAGDLGLSEHNVRRRCQAAVTRLRAEVAGL